MKKTQRRLVFVMLAATAMLWSNTAWIYVKAQLAQHLIDNAWESTLALDMIENRDLSVKSNVIRPWPWADIWPVARLQWLPAHDQTKYALSSTAERDLYVLSGAHGEALAFGPGHLNGTSDPGTGLSVIAGHRDTHFEFLKKVKRNDLLKLQTPMGNWRSYRIQHMAIRHINKEPLLIDETEDGLILITCYPFNAISSGGPLRYVIWAIPDDTITPKPTPQTPLYKHDIRAENNEPSFTI